MVEVEDRLGHGAPVTHHEQPAAGRDFSLIEVAGAAERHVVPVFTPDVFHLEPEPGTVPSA
ncbi:hypothetical protein ACW0JT_24975 [Arthrobacter sp. SA17]